MNRREFALGLSAATLINLGRTFSDSSHSYIGHGRKRQYAVLDAPCNLGLRPPRPGVEPGVGKLAQTLRQQNLVARLHAADAGVVAAPQYTPDIDEVTRYRAGQLVASYMPKLADRIGALIDDQTVPIVLGGDCSILLGAAIALKRRGRYGLVHMDAHGDYVVPRGATKFTAAGLDLALATGHGPEALANIEQLSPYFREQDVVCFGNREIVTEQDGDLASFLRSPIKKFPYSEIKRIGVKTATHRVRQMFETGEMSGYWVHIDADVLDSRLMPAVDAPEEVPGFTYDELAEIVSILLSSGEVKGMHIAIYDPDLDPDRKCAVALADALVKGLTAAHDVLAEE